MFGTDVLLEIDETLNQLICNAEAIQNVDLTDLNDTEIDAFQKTQESLLQHLMHMDQTLVSKRDSLKAPNKRSTNVAIQEKLLKFETMKRSYHQNLEAAKRKNSILLKRRNKKVLVVR